MSDQDSGDKTEQPTEKKLRDAKEKGQVAQSRELTSIAAIIVVVTTFGMSYRYNFHALAKNALSIFDNLSLFQDNSTLTIAYFMQDLSLAVKIFVFPIILASIASFFVSIGQIGGITIKKDGIKFDIAKLNPVDNGKNIFSKKSIVKFLRQFIELSVMVIVAYYICSSFIQDVLLFPYLGINSIVTIMTLFLFKIFSLLFAIHIIFSIFDFVLEKKNLKKQLMMSLHDIKEEFKESEGDPEIKHKRKELHRELLEDNNAFGGFVGSGILFANPTHIAVFVIFIPKKLKLPAITIMETDEEALKLVRLATELGIPVVRDIWLARQLYKLGKINSYVPGSLLSHVADYFSKNIKSLPSVVSAIKNTQIPAPPKVDAELRT